MASVESETVLQPASTADLKTLARALTSGYTGYEIPIQIDALELQHHIEKNDLDLTASYIVLHQAAVVGIALLGLREGRGWVGGLGVHPHYRRHGIGRRLMQALIAQARQQGLTSLQLEVIESNHAAIRLYQTLGLAASRRLFVLNYQPEALKPGYSGQMEASDLQEALWLHTQFHAQPTPWQRGYETLAKLDDSAQVWVLREGAEAVAYALGFVSATSIHLLDLACAPGQSVALHSLISQLHHHYPEASASIVNLAEDEPGSKVLFALGWQTRLVQHEMHLAL